MEFEMRARLNRIRLRDLALFVVVAGVVALATVFIGRESGVGDEAKATSTADVEERQPPAEDGSDGSEEEDNIAPLTLTLCAPEICETKRASSSYAAHWTQDEDGTNHNSTLIAWQGVSEIPVEWTVSGGTAPYTLMIDGESEDGSHEYAGALGTASVSCALDIVQTVIGGPYNNRYRRYLQEPRVDSGRKTIRATVTDAGGATAETTAGVYVITDSGGSNTPLRAGETYRIFDQLITIPDEITTAFMGDHGTPDGGESSFSIGFRGPGYRAFVDIGISTGTVYRKEIQRSALTATEGAAGQAQVDDEVILLSLQRIGDSVGQQPQGISE